MIGTSQVEKKIQHWFYEIDSNQLMWLVLNRHDSAVNSLNREIFKELDHILSHEVASLKGLIITSGKEKGFIAGADITQFQQLANEQEAFKLIREAQSILDKLAALSFPTVAMINGFCLGGGLELALACRYRIVVDDESILLGLPEVKLGLHPGWGGTVRLPKLIGSRNAMRLMLTGEPISPRVAQTLGLVDQVVPARHLKRAAAYYALKKIPRWRKKHSLHWSNLSLLRPALTSLFYKRLQTRIQKEHYPAPYAIVWLWKESRGQENAFIAEAKSIAHLLMTPYTQNMVRVFFLREKLKAVGKGKEKACRQVHVIGAGVMGGDIAAWCVVHGLVVTLQDRSWQALCAAFKRARQFFREKVSRVSKQKQMMDHLIPDVDGFGVAKADLVIEAVFEDLKLKQDVLLQADSKLAAEAILATNTSSLSLDTLAEGLVRPERLMGMHFFNPVFKMPLVEISGGEKTPAALLQRAAQIIVQVGKLPLIVGNQPGFLINQVLTPYLLEAMYLLDEGISPLMIDEAAILFGMPMGPLALADRVGLDICLSVAKNLLGEGRIPQWLLKLVEQNNLGSKTGKGFYHYPQTQRIPIPRNPKSQDVNVGIITDRLVLTLLNAAVTCLHNKVVADADFLDGGLVFGMGFPPFLGGPIHYARQRGIENIVTLLKQFSQTYGSRFLPSPGWKELH